MTDPIPRALSGLGQDIFDKIHRPLLTSSKNFDRVSSYFGPKGLAKAITEIAEIWKAGGKIRLILSPADTSEIHQALENVTTEDGRKRNTIKKSIEIAVQKIKGNHPEVISALEEMLLNDLLQVAIVIPKEGNGLFHSKFSIYHIESDSEIGKQLDPEISKYVAVHGSFNESDAGYGKNIEDASTHRSWNPSECDVAQIFKLRFDELWNDFAPDTISIPITNSIKRALNIRSDYSRTSNPIRNLTIGAYLDKISTIPSSLGFNDSIWLMPHQISVVNSAMIYTPIRSMLCDEVGLGKTIQAGAIMSRLIAENTCDRVLIIVPAATLTQWAIEISSKFGHPVSLYTKQYRKRFFDGALLDETWSDPRAEPTELVDNNKITIISSEWFRLRTIEYAETLASNYQLMILDEAHHARLDNWEKREGTKLYEKIKVVSKIIPNVLLLTATPFQTGEKDYLSLLDILQSVTEQDEEDLRIGSGVVSGELPWNQNQQSMLIRSIERRLDLLEPHIPSTLYETVRDSPKPLKLSTLSRIINENTVDENLLFTTLPTSLLTFRNTRSMLREIGMGFPDVIFEALAVKPNEYEDVIKKSENFIKRYLGGRDDSSGLTRSLYYQRAISSIAALHSSLTNRLDGILFNAIEESDFQLDFERMPPASAIEIERIEILLEEIEEVMEIAPDPKIIKLVELIENLQKEGRRTLVFSRYTATTNSIEAELWDAFPNLTIGRYDGENIRIRKAGQSAPSEVTKDALVKDLMNEEIDVIVCSDAASEGLNLQSASAVINVDVPWNPARVLQRIGRIDRLGQMSPIVKIYNLVYFDTIEQRMYRVLDNRQTDAIRLLGEFPEIFSTEESRHMYQVFGVPITARVDQEQAQIREDVSLSRLLNESKHHDSHLSLWIQSVIDQHPELNLSENPAAKDFAMRHEEILRSNMNLHPDIGGELGYAVCERGTRHALLAKSEQGFLPLTPSVIMNSNEEVEIEWYGLVEAVGIYNSEFASIPLHSRSPGLMSDRFYQKNDPPEVTFMAISY